MAFTDLTIAEKLTQIGQDLASLKEQANTTTGGTDNTLKEAVETLIAGYGQGGGSGLFDELSELGYDAETIAEYNAIKDEELIYSASIPTFSEQIRDVNLRYAKYFDTNSYTGAFAYRAFVGCRLKAIPNYDLSGATTLYAFLSGAQIPYFVNRTTSNCTIFQEFCTQNYNIKLVDIDCSSATNLLYSFQSCSALETIRLKSTSQCAYFGHTFEFCSSLTTIEGLDTSAGISFNSMFNACTSLVTLDALDVSNATDVINILWACSSLQNFGGLIGLTLSVNLSRSTLLTHDSLMNVINNLAEVTTSPTLTIGSTNLAKLSEDEIAVCTGKGWNIA